MIFTFILDIFAACLAAVKDTLESIEIMSGATLWHFVIVLMIIGVLISCFVHSGKA